MKKNALIIFTREPEAGLTKTRMMPYYSEDECAELHTAFLRDIARELRDINADIWVCYTSSLAERAFVEVDSLKMPSKKHLDASTESPILKGIFEDARGFIRQQGENLGIRMFNAIDEVLGLGYESCALIGTDIPEIKCNSIERAFELLSSETVARDSESRANNISEKNRAVMDPDIVLAPTEDGGYYLVAMKKASMAPFALETYGHPTVLENTIASIEAAGLSYALGDTYQDMDEPSDIRELIRRYRKSGKLSRTATGRFLTEHLKVSIIVPVYNEESTIEGLQDQLEQYKDEAEILIVDGDSSDATCDMIREGFTLIHSKKGRANQMNLGAEMSSGDVLFFLHADSVLPNDALGEIRCVMQRHCYGCFGVKFPSKHLFMYFTEVRSNGRAFYQGIPYCDQGIFVDRDVFFEIGMFPRLSLMEDYQFSHNMRAAGYMPGETKGRIITSNRRYGKSAKSILKTAWKMTVLRSRYRRGVSTDQLAADYRDIR